MTQELNRLVSGDEVLGWHEIRARASAFARSWRDASRERAEAQSFWNDFFGVFGLARRTVAVYEHHAQRASTGRGGFADLFWPGVLIAEHKSLGEDLAAALETQALDYLPGMPVADIPRLAVASDFARMRIRDLDSGNEVEFPLDELPNYVEWFGPMAGRTRRRQAVTEEEVNLVATGLLAELHDALLATGYEGHPLRVFMVRLLFALSADDTGIWERDLFHHLLTDRTRKDGSDTGNMIAHLWQVLNQAPERRSRNLDEDLREFSHINGGLFKEVLPIADFSADMRDTLLDCCVFDWSAISPVIFGSLFQEVMTPADRREIGAHYTTETNILRVAEALFMRE
jgi:hypothetical protein